MLRRQTPQKGAGYFMSAEQVTRRLRIVQPKANITGERRSRCHLPIPPIGITIAVQIGAVNCAGSLACG
jgi:hypothetical protein